MSKSIVKRALEILDHDVDEKKPKSSSIKKKKQVHSTANSIIQDRKQLHRTCARLKQLSKPVVTSEQIEQLNNYRFGGPSKRDLQNKKKKEKEENIFTEEDFKRFEREYNPPIQKKS